MVCSASLYIILPLESPLVFGKASGVRVSTLTWRWHGLFSWFGKSLCALCNELCHEGLTLDRVRRVSFDPFHVNQAYVEFHMYGVFLLFIWVKLSLVSYIGYQDSQAGQDSIIWIMFTKRCSVLSGPNGVKHPKTSFFCLNLATRTTPLRKLSVR